MTTGKLDLTCLGFDRVERSYQPRLIALSIVPGHFVVEHAYVTCMPHKMSFYLPARLDGAPGSRIPGKHLRVPVKELGRS